MKSPLPQRPRARSPATAGGLDSRFLEAWESLACPASWRRLLVAVSGGPDSLALLHLLHGARDSHRLELVVAHVDHGIHPDSAAVAQRVVDAAARLGVAVVLGRLALGPGSSETRSRSARHEWLERTRRQEGADAVVFAHHLDDQAETVLMRVLAGSGPAGLAGMQARRGARVRPLLGFSRAELGAYLEERGVGSWADPANDDPAHRRSWVRNAVLPQIAESVPDLVDRLVRVGEQAAANRRAWDALLAVLPGVDPRLGTDRISVAGLPLAGYDSDLAVAVLQAAARRAGCVLGPRRAARVLALLKAGRSGRVLELGAGWRVELAFGRLCFFRAAMAPAPLRLEAPSGEARWGVWLVRWRHDEAPPTLRRDGWVAWFIGQEAVLRAPEAGDRVRPLGGSGSRLVARCLQDARVERSRRGAWPVVEMDGGIEWVAGVCRGEGAVPSLREDALRIELIDG